AARAFGIQVESRAIQSLDDLDRAVDEVSQAPVDGVFSLGGPTFFAQRARIVDLVTRHQLPASFAEKDYATAGGLLSYGPNVEDNFRRAATFADKILKGASPADLPIEQPTTFDFVINLKTAQDLGLTIPPSVLAEATEVIR